MLSPDRSVVTVNIGNFKVLGFTEINRLMGKEIL